jgi:NTE family protein
VTALVLSAGGMFGAYHAGAWRTLAGNWQPDLVVGSSVGALNGWAIAGGAQPEELIAMWSDARLAGLMRLRIPWLPWRGLFDPRVLEKLAREMMERYRPRVAYFATVVKVPSLRLRWIRGEEMTWRHLMAACAVPLGFPPVRLDGSLSVDGGLLCKLPVNVAAALGASRVLAVDAMPVVPSRAVRAAGLAARLAGECVPPPVTPPRVDMVAPATPLGTLTDAIRWKAHNIAQWIERGALDAGKFLETRDSARPGVFD